jgi:hypothetical protein
MAVVRCPAHLHKRGSWRDRSDVLSDRPSTGARKANSALSARRGGTTNVSVFRLPKFFYLSCLCSKTNLISSETGTARSRGGGVKFHVSGMETGQRFQVLNDRYITIITLSMNYISRSLHYDLYITIITLCE